MSVIKSQEKHYRGKKQAAEDRIVAENKLFDKILRLLAPVKCMGCREITLEKAPFCRSCLPQFAELMYAKCPVCGKDKKECTCVGARNSRFLFYYHSKLSKNIIASLKYHITSFKAEYIAGLLYMLVPTDVKFDAVLFPPRSEKNKRKHGFDQAEIISKALAEKLGIPCLNVLKRTRGGRKSKEQKLLSAEQRIKNVKGAFEVDRSLIDGLDKVILFDDVMTTGATVSECAKLLKRAGIKKIFVLTVAKTPKALKATFRRNKKRTQPLRLLGNS